MQERGERIEGEGGGVGGGFRQSSDFLQQVFFGDLARSFHIFIFCQLGDGRCAGHGRDAALGAETDVGDAAGLEFEREFEDVSAGGIFYAYGCVGGVERAGVARMVEMVEEFGGVHVVIVMAWMSELAASRGVIPGARFLRCGNVGSRGAIGALRLRLPLHSERQPALRVTVELDSFR